MELNQAPPSSQDPDSDLSRQLPGAQPFASPTSPPSSEDIYRRIQSYPFHSDQDYQLGLAAILGHPDTAPEPSELLLNQDLVLQAQCFYLARKYGLGQIDVEAYKEWLAISQKAKEAFAQRANGTGAPESVQPPVAVLVQERPSAPTPSTAAAATATASALPLQQPSPPGPAQPDRPSAPTPSTAAAATTSQQSQTTSSQSADPPPPYPTSFAEIVDLITQNKPIPGIEEIPTTVLELGSSKQDRTSRRRKPWEKDDDQEAELEDTANTEAEADVSESIDTERRIQTGEGVMKILQPGAIPDSGLVARE